MTDDEYERTQTALQSLRAQVEVLDLDGFLARITHAEVLGPVLDPTLYRRAARQLDVVKRIALAAKRLKEVVPDE